MRMGRSGQKQKCHPRKIGNGGQGNAFNERQFAFSRGLQVNSDRAAGTCAGRFKWMFHSSN